MTYDELKKLIEDTIDERLIAWLGEFEISDEDMGGEPEEQRSLEEVLESIERHRWTPPGSPSVLEMLREDRDR